MILIFFVVAVVTLVFPVLGLVLIVTQRRRLGQAEAEIARLRWSVGLLDARIEEIRNTTARSKPVTPAPPAVPPIVAVPFVAPTREQPVPPPTDEPRSIDPVPMSEIPVSEADAMERAIGERWLLYSGILLLLLGVAFFLRYAFDRNWLAPIVRVGIGGVAGLAMTLGGTRLATAGFRRYGMIVAGAGIAAWYLSVYSALNFYDLLSIPVAFALLVAISVVAAWLADMYAAAPLAVVAVCGGFATPFLVGRGEDAQLTLFSYDALLIAATVYLSIRRRWWWLNLVAAVLTLVTVASWGASFYTPVKAIRTELFITLYCAMFLGVVRAGFRTADEHGRIVARVLLLAPIVYHVASVWMLLPHRDAFFVYLILTTIVALIVADRSQLPIVRAVAWVAVAWPLAIWLDDHPRAVVAVPIACIAALYVLHLAAQIHAMPEVGPLTPWDVALVHANGIGAYAAVYLLLEDRSPQWLATIAAALAVWNAAVAAVMSRRVAAVWLQWAAVAATLAAIAVAIRLDGPWVVVMWAAESATIIAVAVRTREEWFRMAGWVLMLIAVIRWLGPDVQSTTIAFVPVMNPRALSGGLIIALLYTLAAIERRQSDASTYWRTIEQATLLLAASVMTVAVMTTEIRGYWSIQELRGEPVELVSLMMISVAWAAYAAGTITVGIARGIAPLRYFGMVLLGVTVVKVLVIDLDTLAGIYRIAAFIGVGLVLLFASFLYQRRRSTGNDSR